MSNEFNQADSLLEFLTTNGLFPNTSTKSIIDGWEFYKSKKSIPEPTEEKSKEFQWTHELTKQAIHDLSKKYCCGDWMGFEKEFEKWEQSHSSTPAKPEGKDWQIECFVGYGQNYWRQKNGGYHSQPFVGDLSEEHFLDFPEVYKIWRVKRTSDGEVFSVGDEIGWGLDGTYYTILKSFKIENGILKFSDGVVSQRFKNGHSVYKERYIDFMQATKLHKKLPSPSTQQPKDKPQQFKKQMDDYVNKNAEQPMKERTEYGLLQDCLAFFDKDTTIVPQELYKEVFNWLLKPIYHIYTQSEMDKAIVDAFNAAREEIEHNDPNGVIGYFPSKKNKFKSPEDYLKTINT